jgi:hypothetical protein
LWNTGCKVSAARTGSIFKSSAFSWSVPGAFLFFKFLMAFCISSFEDGSVESAVSNQRMGQIYQVTKQLSGKKAQVNMSIKDKDNNTLTTER